VSYALPSDPATMRSTPSPASHGSWTSRIFTGVAAVGGALTGAALLSAALPLALTGAVAGAAFGALAGSKVGDEMESRAHVVDIVHAALGIRDYSRLVAHSLLQLRLCVFCRNAAFAGSSLPEVVSLWVHDAGVVPGVATKGTIGVSLRLPKSAQPIAFVCSHLAAHEGRSNMQLRNTQLAQGMLASGSPLMESHAHVFVLGDLNYRLDGKALMERAHSDTAADTQSAATVGDSDDSAPWRSVVDAISRSAWADLAAVDELTQQRAEAGHPLSDFNEGPLLFAPTYKVQRDTRGTAASAAPAQPPPQPQQQQQGRQSIQRRGQSAAAALPVPSYSKKRLPAWTDRCVRTSCPAQSPFSVHFNIVFHGRLHQCVVVVSAETEAGLDTEQLSALPCSHH
jgi:hypothetical protein